MPLQLKNKISTEWLAGLTQERQAEIRRLWRLSNPLADRLQEVLKKKLGSLQNTHEGDYDRQSWPYWRADRDGQIRILEEVIKLLPDQR